MTNVTQMIHQSAWRILVDAFRDLADIPGEVVNYLTDDGEVMEDIETCRPLSRWYNIDKCIP